MKKVFLSFFILSVISTVNANGSRKLIASIPFDMVGTYVVINLKINNSTPLRLILDCGIQNTIITEVDDNDELSLNFTENHTIQGLGNDFVLNAFVSRNNIIAFGRFKLFNKTIYALKEDIFNLTRQTGTRINGLLGADIFQNHIVQIDYSHKRIRFYDRDNFSPPDNYGYMPMTIERQKMYIHLSILEKDTARRSIKMLIDTGAELTAWFQTLTNKAVSIPDKSIKGKIGEGLSGEITGYFARIPQICIANFCVKNPIVAFPDSSMIAEIIKNSDRDGTIGSRLLSRFNLIIDTKNKKFYFKPNANFDKPFVYNIAGIEVAQLIPFLPQFEITNVWKSSPADLAGIKSGDLITEMNGERLTSYTVQEVRAIFEKPLKKPLTIIVSRNGKNMSFKVDMKARI